jgi:pyruvate/2-oxoglutarate dehydrogenase complex dihydrolipoamide acyltransferase (E2) component
MTSMIFKKVILAVVMGTFTLAALPVRSAFAAGDPDPSTPPEEMPVSNERLERLWAREIRVFERLGKAFDRSDAMVEKIQSLIDQASQNGKDASAVQAALDAFEAAVNQAEPLYQSAQDVISSHKGFDENGKVTEPVLARETVKELGLKLKEVKATLGGTGKALREAIKAFREANHRPAPPDERDS